MAKNQKSEQRLTEALRVRGLRKSVAQTLAQATGRARRGTRPPKRVQRLLAELKDITGEVEKRLTGGGDAKRKAAAKKGAETRKRNGSSRAKTAAKGTTSSGRRRAEKSPKSATRRKTATKS